MSIDYLEMTGREIVESGGQIKTASRVRSDEAYKKKAKQMENTNREQFTRFADKECSQVYQTLTIEQAGALMNLFAYMELGDSGSVKHNGKRAGKKELAKILGKSEATVKRIIGELEALGYVEAETEGRKKVYSVNTLLATRGEQVGKGYFTKLYIKRLRDALKAMTLQEAGLLFFMIPNMNTRAFVLCSNPYEMDIDKIALWTREELAEACGLSLVQVKRIISSLMKKQVIIGVKTHRTAIVLSPELISRQTTKVSVYEVTQILRNEVNGSEVSW